MTAKGYESRSSANHPRWNSNARMVTKDGYVKIRVGRDHPLADPNGYVYEHLLVWVSAGRSRPARNQLLHHKNEHRDDNRLQNLAMMPRPDHNRLHMAKRKRGPDGRVLPIA